MAGIGEGQGVFHGLAVADLADQDHIRRLAQGVLQRGMEAAGVHTHFALVDDGFLVPVHVLHRVFDGDDVAAAVAVAVVDQRRQGGGLARAGAADEEHQAALLHHHLEQHFGQLEVLEARDIQLDVARDDGHLVALAEDVDAEAADVRQRDRQVHLQFLVELGALLGIHDRVGDPRHVTGLERLVAERPEQAVELGAGRRAGGQVKVGTILAGQDFQHRREVHGASAIQWIGN
ncbi:hypothetical protein D9M68_666240 [compost metagenome]